MTNEAPTSEGRRGFLRSGLMWLGLGAGYAMGIAHFLRYLVPLGDEIRYREMFVGPVDELRVGQSRKVKTPSGETYVMARLPDETVEGRPRPRFRVLSDICPHLGCRVHWEADRKRFYCPCHAGVFDESGHAVSGPPADADQNLTALDTVIRGNSVFVMIKES